MEIVKKIIVILSAIIPNLLILKALTNVDRKTKEPFNIIFWCIFNGFIAPVICITIQSILLKYGESIFNFFELSNFDYAKVIILVVVEEFCKFTILYFILKKSKYFDEVYDSVIYSAIISLSFAVIETIWYINKENFFSDILFLALSRQLTSIPLHLCCSFIMGYYFGLSKLNYPQKHLMTKSFFIPVLIHTIYNLILTYISFNISNTTLLNTIIIFMEVSIFLIAYLYLSKVKKDNYKI